MTGGGRIAKCCAAAILLLVTPRLLPGQSNVLSATYARMDGDAIDYRGPGRAVSADIASKAATIGILLPMLGPKAEQGQMLLKAAQQAIADENQRGSMPDGRGFALAVRNESGNWGQSSSELMRLITEDQALALITGADGNLAHQAEQIANKLGFAVVTLASDSTTTQINIPWIFRLVPSDAQQAEVMTRAIFGENKDARVLLIHTSDHDGRVGRLEFTRAAGGMGAHAPVDLQIDAENVEVGRVRDAVDTTKPEIAVFWTDSLVFEKLIDTVHRNSSVLSVYACEKTVLPDPAANAGIAAVRVPVSVTSSNQIDQPALVYNAVRLVAGAIRMAGPNRARVRDALAHATTNSTVESMPIFDGAGNLRAKPQLTTLMVGGVPSQRVSAK